MLKKKKMEKTQRGIFSPQNDRKELKRQAQGVCEATPLHPPSLRRPQLSGIWDFNMRVADIFFFFLRDVGGEDVMMLEDRGGRAEAIEARGMCQLTVNYMSSFVMRPRRTGNT